MLLRNFIANGLFIGLIATLITSTIMMLFRARGKETVNLYLFFGKSILGKKVKKGHANTFAFLLHLVIGTLLGFAYVLVFKSAIWAGLAYGIGLWLAMMLVLFPIFGQKIFAKKLDKKNHKIRAWMLTLIFHVIYGIMLGWIASL